MGKGRSRFVARRIDGLLDEPRPGAPRSITDADVERVVTLMLEETPKEATHWSTRSRGRRGSGLSCLAATSRPGRRRDGLAPRPHHVAPSLP